MAQDARNGRQLMRQRGAGTSDMPDIEFGLDMTAGSRQERQLMRQRGAGNRQINNIDFGFAFTTPSTVGKGRSRTRSKTPTTVSGPPNNATASSVGIDPSLLQHHVPSSAGSRRSLPPSSATRRDLSGQPLRKRRRLSELSNLTTLRSPGLPLAQPPHGTPHESMPDAVQSTAFDDGRISVPTSPLLSPGTSPSMEVEKDKRNQETSAQKVKPPNKKRKRKSIGQQSLFKKKRSSSSLRPLPTPSETQEDTVEPSNGSVQQMTGPSSRGDHHYDIALQNAASPPAQPTAQPPSLVDPIPVVQHIQPKKRKKRKSIVQGKTKRRSSQITAPTPSHGIDNIEVVDQVLTDQDPDVDQPNERSADHEPDSVQVDDEVPQTKLTVRSLRSLAASRRAMSSEPYPHGTGDDGDDADEAYLPDEASPGPTPAPKRAKLTKQQAHKLQRLSRNRPSDRGTSRSYSRKPVFPILTHRMTNTRYLPTILEEPGHQLHQNADPDNETIPSDSDELSHPVLSTFTTRTAPNAADILSQICRETIDTSISTLKSDTTLSRSDLKHRLDALRSFRDALDTRLFELSQSLDQRLNMEARLRKIRKEKAALQNQWLELRRQRDQLDLRKDAVRRRHWEGEVLGRKKFEVSQAAFGVEATAEMEGEADEVKENGLEMEIREVARNVSSFEDGGILNTIKNFNARLEALATELG